MLTDDGTISASVACCSRGLVREDCGRVSGGGMMARRITTIIRGGANVRVRPLFRRRISFSAFSGSSFHIMGMGGYRTMPGDGGLLEFALSSNARGREAVLSKMRTFCRPRRLMNGALLTVMGLPPHSVVKVSSYNVLLSTVRGMGKRRGLGLMVLSSTVPTNTGLC